jgi:hypothetical protein
MRNETEKPIIPIGYEVKPWGKVIAVGWLQGERYYWLLDIRGISMMTAARVEAGL